MPQRIICSGCSYVLYEGSDFGPPAEFVRKCGGVCPKCGRILSFLPLSIDVKSVNK